MQELSQIDLKQLSSLTSDALKKINAWMPEHHRAIKSFGRQNSQTTAKLMSLTMLSAGPYRALRQCLAEIERRKNALQENIFKLRKQRVEIDRKDLDDPLQAIEAEELQAQIDSGRVYIEGALKDIGALQDAYDQIRQSHNIPECWDEADFEAGEIEHHIRQAFTLAYRDVMSHGRLSVSTCEYMQQFGIHPYAALARVEDYINSLQHLRANRNIPDINVLHEWLDQMYRLYKDCPAKAAGHLGLTDLITKWSLYIDPNRQRHDDD